MMNMMGLANKRLGQYPFNIFIIYDQYFYKWPIIYICMKLIAKGLPFHYQSLHRHTYSME